MIEKSPQNFFSKLCCILLIIIVFILMYQPWKLSLREVQGNEGFYATVMQEVNFESYPVVTAHNVKVRNSYFLYPHLCRFLQDKFSLGIEEPLRYTAFFWAVAIALSAGITAGALRSFKAGLVAFSFFLGCNFVFEKSVLANPTTMAVFFVFLSHISWVYFGFIKTKWNTAWLTSLILLSVAFLCNGFISIIYFAIPLLFTHRPLKVFSKLSKSGFIVGGIILLGVVLLWFVPYLRGNDYGTINYTIFHAQRLGEWLLHIVYTPFEMIVRLLPWTFIAWLPFCVALRPLDETPVMSHYFRVLFFSEFIIALVNPFGNIICIIYSLAPLAVLCGLSYDIGVRRYSEEIRKLIVLCSYIAIGLGIATIVYCFIPNSLLKNDLPTFSLGILFLLQAFWIYRYRKRGQIWLIMLSISCSIGLFYYATMYKYRIKHTLRREIGETIHNSLHADKDVKWKDKKPIYTLNIAGFYNEAVYIEHPIIKVNSLSELPKNEPSVYLLSVGFPQYRDRSWTNLMRTSYQDTGISLWRGDLLPESELINRDFSIDNEGGKSEKDGN